MTYSNTAHANFSGGLVLADAPNSVGPTEALDCLNVEFSTRGAVQQRAGYAQLTGTELTNQPDSLANYYRVGAANQLVVGNGNRLDVLDTSGASVANSTSPTASPHYFCRFGGATGVEVMYIANGTDQVRKLAATTFTAPAGLSGQTGKFLAVTPTSNRLVVARESGSTAGNNPSSVNFSDAGAPETFTATNYIDLDPGDGEAIMGVVAWREYVFIFKETKFWVHYGEGLTTVGGPEFEVRKVDAKVGLVASRALCAGPEGVYFLGRQGVYRTTGAEPELISAPLDPFFGQGTVSDYFRSSTLNHAAITACAMCWHDHRLYLACPTAGSTNDRILVHDPRYGWWTLYDIPAAAMAKFRPSSTEELVFAAPTGSNYVNRHSPTYTADAMATGGTGGTAISSRWRTGWINYDSPDVKTIRETELWGSGAFSFGITKDFEDVGGGTTDVTFASATTDTWDPDGIDAWGSGVPSDFWELSSTIKAKLVRKAIRAEHFSLSVSNSTLNETFSLYRIENRIRESEIPTKVAREVAA